MSLLEFEVLMLIFLGIIAIVLKSWQLFLQNAK